MSKERTEYEILLDKEKVEQARCRIELDARRDQDAHELMVMRHEAVTRYQEGMDKHDVIDPMASDVIY